jgi:hypothetical protein
MDRVLSLQGPFVSEWRPLLKVSMVYGLYYAATVCIVIGSFLYSRKAKHLGLVFVWLMLTSAAFLIYRTLPFYSIGTVILLGPHLADCWNRLYDRIARKDYVYGPLLMATIIVMVISVAGLTSQLRGLPGQLVIFQSMPIKAVSLLKKANLKANVLVEFNWAEYFIWHLGPQMKVAIDPRCETAYSDYVLFNLYCGFITTSSHWDDILDKAPTDLVLISPNTIVGTLLEKKSGWEKIYTDSTCSIFAKKGSLFKYRLAELNEKYSVPPGIPNVFP